MSKIKQWLKQGQIFIKKKKYQDAKDKLDFILMNQCKFYLINYKYNKKLIIFKQIF